MRQPQRPPRLASILLLAAAAAEIAMAAGAQRGTRRRRLRPRALPARALRCALPLGHAAEGARRRHAGRRRVAASARHGTRLHQAYVADLPCYFLYTSGSSAGCAVRGRIGTRRAQYRAPIGQQRRPTGDARAAEESLRARIFFLLHAIFSRDDTRFLDAARDRRGARPAGDEANRNDE